jgi:hypothetical protein
MSSLGWASDKTHAVATENENQLSPVEAAARVTAGTTSNKKGAAGRAVRPPAGRANPFTVLTEAEWGALTGKGNYSCGARLLSLLRSSAHDVRPHVGWPSPHGIQGVVMELTGQPPPAHPVVLSLVNWDRWRGAAQIKRIVAILKRFAVKPTTTQEGDEHSDSSPTAVFFLSTHDVDFWTLVQDDPSLPQTTRNAFAESRKRMHQLLDDCLNVYLLSWNPCGMNPETGQIGRRTIPVPDPHPIQSTPPQNAKSKYPTFTVEASPQQPQSLVFFRGRTTGFRPHPGSYSSTSDRGRVVRSFSNLPEADVKFTERVQGVSESEVPDEFVTSPDGGTDGRLASGAGKASSDYRYAFHLDVDGNSNSWDGLRWKLNSGTAVLKAWSTRGCVQWYYPLLAHGQNVYVFDPRDPWPATLRAVKAIAKDTATLQQMSQNAQNLSAEVFSSASVYGYWIRVFELLLDPAAARSRLANSPTRRRRRLGSDGLPRNGEQNPLDRLFDLLLAPKEGIDGASLGRGLTSSDWRIQAIFPAGKRKLGLWDLNEAESSP